MSEVRGDAASSSSETIDGVSPAPALPAWDEGALAQLEEQERVLRYPDAFGASRALELGDTIVRLAASYDRGITVEITRDADDMVLFAWSADDKAPRNYGFAAGKRRVSRAAGHSSLWVPVAHTVRGDYPELFDFAAGYCPAGGAFPIVVAGERVATVAVSGLHEGKDHELAVRALAAVLGLDAAAVPALTYQAI